MLDLNIAKDREIFRKRLADARKPLTQEQLAEKLGTTRLTISAWETGRNFPPLDTLLQVCKILNTDIGFLLASYNEKRKDLHFICTETGLQQEAVEKLTKERESVDTKILSKIIPDDRFWEILRIITENESYIEHRKNQNDELKDKLVNVLKSGEMQEYEDFFERIVTAMNKNDYIYDLKRYECQILFRDMLEKLLPKG